MRAPPPVEYTSALGRAWRTALSLLVGASVAVPLAWVLPQVASQEGSRQPDPLFALLANPMAQGIVAAWVGLLAVAAFWLSRRVTTASERTLRWDGQDWLLPGGAGGGPDQRGDAALMLDLGPWMLVRFRPCAGGFRGSSWLAFTLAGDLARWAALRGALWNWRARAATRP
jgi:hypothetical protein